jgi:hypothetical protein
MRKHILLDRGQKHIHLHQVHHALNSHHAIHHHHGNGFAGAKKKDINSFKPPTSGIGMKSAGKRITPLKFKL